MAIVAADWTVDRATGAIRYIGDDHGGASPSYATVLELHRWLQDLADDQTSSGDDELDITDENPSSRATDNFITLLGSYNIDDIAAEHLYDGSIVQASGDTIYDGIVNYGNSDVQIQIIQNGAVLTDDWWNFGGGGLNADAAQGISHRFLMKVRDAGADIDGLRLLGTTRVFGKTYSEFPINGTNRGNNVLALSNIDDNFNQTAEGTVATWTTITNIKEGYSAIDVDVDGTDEYFYSEWNKDTYSINQFYERMKYLTRDGSAETLYGLSGELFRGITHELDVTSPAGTFVEPESVSWAGGTGQLLAIDSTTAPTKIWIQVLTGSAPSSGTITGNGGATATVTGRTSRSISTPFCGQSTGSALLGAFGFGVESADLGTNDRLVALDDVTYQPPNNVTFTVGGLVSTEDVVLVGPWDGVSTDSEGNPAFDEDQLSLSTTLNTDNITSVVVSTAIPSDTPSSGYIRVQDDNGFYRRLHYSSWDTSTFIIDSTDGQEDFLAVNATVGNNVWIAYIDEIASGTSASFTAVYSADRDLVVKVRDGGASPIKEYITSASLGSGGGSVSAIRTSDA